LLFRPSGHGALISNLNTLKADIVLIKNIDNIAHDWRKALVIEYEKILLSYFCTLKQDITTVLAQAKRKKIDTELVRALFKKLNLKNSLPTITPAQIITLLDRPLRVCAMVKNEGEPGGGPFWVTIDGQKTLQILEKDQLNARQKEKLMHLVNPMTSPNILMNPLVSFLKNLIRDVHSKHWNAQAYGMELWLTG